MSDSGTLGETRDGAGAGEVGLEQTLTAGIDGTFSAETSLEALSSTTTSPHRQLPHLTLVVGPRPTAEEEVAALTAILATDPSDDEGSEGMGSEEVVEEAVDEHDDDEFLLLDDDASDHHIPSSPADVSLDALSDGEGDVDGDGKIDSDGHLLGDRQWRLPVFTLPARHPRRLYMMSRDPARLLGYHNSSIFHLKHLSVRRLQALPEDRPELDARGLITSAMRKREISLVTARSVFKALGHTVVAGGLPLIDDYRADTPFFPMAEAMTEEAIMAAVSASAPTPAMTAVPAASAPPARSWGSGGAEVSGGPSSLDRVLLAAHMARAADNRLRIIRSQLAGRTEAHTGLAWEAKLTQPMISLAEAPNNEGLILPEDLLLPSLGLGMGDEGEEGGGAFPIALLPHQAQTAWSVDGVRFGKEMEAMAMGGNAIMETASTMIDGVEEPTLEEVARWTATAAALVPLLPAQPVCSKAPVHGAAQRPLSPSPTLAGDGSKGVSAPAASSSGSTSTSASTPITISATPIAPSAPTPAVTPTATPAPTPGPATLAPAQKGPKPIAPTGGLQATEKEGEGTGDGKKKRKAAGEGGGRVRGPRPKYFRCGYVIHRPNVRCQRKTEGPGHRCTHHQGLDQPKVRKTGKGAAAAAAAAVATAATSAAGTSTSISAASMSTPTSGSAAGGSIGSSGATLSSGTGLSISLPMSMSMSMSMSGASGGFDPNVVLAATGMMIGSMGGTPGGFSPAITPRPLSASSSNSSSSSLPMVNPMSISIAPSPHRGLSRGGPSLLYPHHSHHHPYTSAASAAAAAAAAGTSVSVASPGLTTTLAPAPVSVVSHPGSTATTAAITSIAPTILPIVPVPIASGPMLIPGPTPPVAPAPEMGSIGDSLWPGTLEELQILLSDPALNDPTLALIAGDVAGSEEGGSGGHTPILLDVRPLHGEEEEHPYLH